MIRKLAIAAALAVSVAGLAWAANAPVYTDATGIVRSTQGVVVVNPDGSMPVMGGAGGGGGAGTEYTEDAASVADPIGTMGIAVRRDTLSAAQVSANGDNIALGTTSKGELYTHDADVLAALAGVGGGTQYTEDAAAVANPIGTMNMAVRRDTLSVSEVSANGDNIAFGTTAKGELYTHDTDVLTALAGVGSPNYTEDLAAPANPVGPMTMVVRRDTLSTTEVSANGDNIAIGGTSKGEMRVNDNDVAAAIATSNTYLSDMAAASNDPNPASVTVTPTDPMIGPVNETPPASDTGPSGLNGRLQRVAQNQSSNANKGQTFTATLAVDTAIIASGELLNTTPATMTAFCPTATAVMEITNLKVHDADDVGASLDVVVENAATSLGTQNNAPSQTNDTLGETIVAVLPVDAADYFDYGGGKSAFVFPDRRIRFACNGTNTNMFLSAVVRGGATFAGGVLKFTFVMERVG